MANWKPVDAFREIARGDQAAEEFMRRFYVWVEKQDDLFDRDKPVTAEMSAGWDLAMMYSFAKNEFFQKNQAYLWPVIHMSALAWISSEEYATSSDVGLVLAGQVLKSQYQDVFYAVAFCIGGFDHAVAMIRKYRDYHFDVSTPDLGLDKGS